MTQTSRNILLLFAPAYWLAIALLYNGHYWQQFDVNVLAFASFSDIAKMSVFPIVSSLFGAAFGGLLGTIPGYMKDRASWRNALIVVSIVAVAGILFGSAVSVYLALFFAVYYFFKLGISIDTLRSDVNVWYGAAFFLVAIIPLSTYIGADTNARDVKMGYDYQYMVESDKRFRYVGYVGEHFFFLSQAGGTVIRHKDALTSFELTRFDKYPDKPPLFFRWLPLPTAGLDAGELTEPITSNDNKDDPLATEEPDVDQVPKD